MFWEVTVKRTDQQVRSALNTALWLLAYTVSVIGVSTDQYQELSAYLSSAVMYFYFFQATDLPNHRSFILRLFPYVSAA